MESYAASAKSLQLCLTLCDPKDGSPPGSPVPGILQARTLEWVAISFSNAWKSKMKVKLLSRVRPSATPWSAAFQAPPSMGFSRQEHWSGVPLPSPRWNHIVCCNNPLLQSSSTSQGLGEPLKSARVLWMDCSTVLDPDFWHPQLARWEIKAPLCSEGEKKSRDQPQLTLLQKIKGNSCCPWRWRTAGSFLIWHLINCFRGGGSARGKIKHFLSGEHEFPYQFLLKGQLPKDGPLDNCSKFLHFCFSLSPLRRTRDVVPPLGMLSPSLQSCSSQKLQGIYSKPYNNLTETTQWKPC